MTKPTRNQLVTALLMTACALQLAAQDPRAAVVAAAPKTVALSPGSCAQVAEGDIVTFEWNPAFDNATAVNGLKNLSLTFARNGEENLVRRGHGGIVLVAVPPRGMGQGPAPNAVAEKANGYFQLSFRVGQNVEPGDYYLIDASAEPTVAPNYKGQKPIMTNSPLRSPFCLNITASARRGRG